MADCLYQADEFALVHGDLEMASGERATEERDGASTLMQDGAKPGPRCVTVDDELLAEIQKVQHKRCRQRLFEGLERCRGGVGPLEGRFAQELCQGRRYGAKILDEAPVVPG
jgi:hypothetical protein